MMIIHMKHITTIYVVTFVTISSFSIVQAFICMLWPLLPLKILCNSNSRCRDNVSSTIVMALIVNINTVSLPIVCDVTAYIL